MQGGMGHFVPQDEGHPDQPGLTNGDLIRYL
jgi:hypothetical protein